MPQRPRGILLALTAGAAATFLVAVGLWRFFLYGTGAMQTQQSSGVLVVPGEQFERRWSMSRGWTFTHLTSEPQAQGTPALRSDQYGDDAYTAVPSWSVSRGPWKSLPPNGPNGLPNVKIVESAYGFPFLVLHSAARYVGSGSDARQDHPSDGDTAPSSDGRRQLRLEIQPYTLYFFDANLSQFALPTRILWPGFLLNTLFWSGVIASPF